MCYNSYYAINGNMLFFVFYFYFIFFIIFQCGAYDNHKQVFKIVFQLKLKVYKGNIPILFCCNNEIFIKCFFLVFKRILSLFDACYVPQWRAGIAVFYYCSHPVIINKFSHSTCFPKVRSVISYLYYFFCSLILLTHGDVKTNTGPKKSHSYFSCCHWNVNSQIAHNKLKVSLLEAYRAVHKNDFICISEAYFDSSVDHPLNTKRGGVCMYYKESFVVKMIISLTYKNDYFVKLR